MDPKTSLFERERPRLLSIAYGLLSSYTDAEDTVQDAWLRYQGSEDEIRQPEAWLTTVVVRMAIDHLRSAQHRREEYPGMWLPEPVSQLPDPESRAALRSMLSVGFLLLMEKLSPDERSVFVLREGLDHSYQEIAEMVGKSEAACRQIFSRARRRLQEQDAERLLPANDRVIAQYVDALSSGDEEALLALLADDAVFYGDGGGRVPSVMNPIFGADRIMRFLFGLLRKFPGSFSWRMTSANGDPALLVMSDGLRSVLTFSCEGDRIARLHLILNPDKLSSFS